MNVNSNSGFQDHGMMNTRVSCSSLLGSGALTRACLAILDSAYVFIGGLHFDLTEGDVITIFSQCVNYSGYLNVVEPLGKVWGSYGRQSPSGQNDWKDKGICFPYV
jgi:hypothetical protein